MNSVILQDFNSQLDNLSEHFDIPKVSWTKWEPSAAIEIQSLWICFQQCRLGRKCSLTERASFSITTVCYCYWSLFINLIWNSGTILMYIQCTFQNKSTLEFFWFCTCMVLKKMIYLGNLSYSGSKFIEFRIEWCSSTLLVFDHYLTFLYWAVT